MVLRTRLLAGLALLALAAATTTLSSAGFTATSANPNSKFTANANFPSTCTAGSVSAVADIDTSIRSAGPAPTGADTFLSVGTSTTQSVNAVFRSLVRFQLPAIPSGCSFTSASLRLFTTTATTPRTLNVHQVSGAWTEATTWPGPAFGATVLASASAAAGTVSWNVSSTVQAMYGGAANNGFLVKDSAESFAQTGNRTQTFSSSEAATASQRPTLVVSYQ